MDESSVKGEVCPTNGSESRIEIVAMPGQNLLGALLKAQKNAEAVDKASRNPHHNYRYASAEAIMREAREALTEAGVVVFPMGWKEQGGRMHVTYCVGHPDSGETMTVDCSTPVIPEKFRPPDKAEATALTYDLGYFLRGLLLIPRVDPSHEVDARDDRPVRRVPPQALGALAHRMRQEQARRKDDGGNGVPPAAKPTVAPDASR